MTNNFSLLIPEFLVTGLAFLILSLDLFISEKRKNHLVWVGVIGLFGILIITLLIVSNGILYQGLLVFDDYTNLFRIFFLIAGIIVLISSNEFVKSHIKYQGEFYGILIFTILSAMLLASSSELLTAYISLELLSFGLYVLVSFDRYNLKSNESGVKYVLLGAFSSALILYGISNIYGVLGTTRFDEISLMLVSINDLNPFLILGFIFLFAGLGFKLSAVPFHMWAPDVYEGSPLPITAWLSVGSKVATIALVLRLFCESLLEIGNEWQLIIIVLSVATMLIGNLGALVQTNIKRLLAFSSVGHMGYILMGISALISINEDGSISTGMTTLVLNGIIFYVIAYAITNFAAFTSVIAVYNHTAKDSVSDFAGLAKRSPFLSLVLVCSMFSLAGLPVFAGFTSKFYLFNAVASQDLLWLVGIGIVTSLISLYYYLMIARQMYIEEGIDLSSINISLSIKLVLGVLLVGMIVGGIFPSPIMDLIELASEALIS